MLPATKAVHAHLLSILPSHTTQKNHKKPLAPGTVTMFLQSLCQALAAVVAVVVAVVVGVAVMQQWRLTVARVVARAVARVGARVVAVVRSLQWSCWSWSQQ
jgi:hypothetical protein